MQRAILVQVDGSTTEKRVYAGDVSDTIMNQEVSRLQALYPTGVVSLYQDTDPAFVAA